MTTIGLTLIIARLTVLEAVRRRTLWALVALTAVVVLLSGAGFQYLVSQARAHGTAELQLQVGVSQVLILCAFMFSFILAATAAFLAAPAIAGDVESGVLLAMLARPLGRGTFVVGRWLGLATVTAAYGGAAGLGEIAALKVASGYGPPDPAGAIGGLAAQAVVVLSLTILCSSRIPTIASGAIAVVLFGLTWGIGVLGGVGQALGADALATAGTVSRLLFPSDGLWRATIFALEPPLIVAAITGSRPLQALAANPFFAATGPSPLYLAWCILWVIGVLGLTSRLFARREL